MPIAIEVEATGVNKFKQEMSQATASVKAYGAELRVCEATYQQTGDQAAYLTEKTGILRKQLDEQKRAVAAAEKALEQVTKQYGEGSKQATEWRTKLAQARATMIQTETAIKNTDAAMDALSRDDVSGVADGLEDVSKEAKKADKAADELSESVGGIAGKLDRDSIIKGLDSIADAMTAVLTKAWNLGKALWQVSVDAATWGDETRDAANATNLSTTRYQQAAYAAQFFGSSIESLTAAQPKLVQAIKGAENGVLQIGDTLVNTMEWASDGKGGFIRQERSWLDVMMDSLDALGDVESEFDREAIAMQLFGKSYRDYMGIMSSGTDAFRKKMGDAPVVGEDSVNNLADANDEIKDMNAALETLKLDVLAALAPDIELIAKAVGDLARNLDGFIKSEQGQKLLTDLSAAIQGIVDNLTRNVDFESIVETATSVIEGINEALGWLADNKVDVVGAIRDIAAAIVILKTASLGLTLANGIFGLKNALGLGNGTTTTGGNTTGGNTTGSPVVAPNTSTGGADGLTYFGGAPGLIAGIGLAQLWNSIQPETEWWNKNREKYGHNVMTDDEAVAEMRAAMGIPDPSKLTGRQADLYNMASYGLSDRPGQGFLGMFNGVDQGTVNATVKWFQGQALDAILSPELLESLKKADTVNGDNTQLLKDIQTEILKADPEMFAAGEESMTSLAEGMESATADVTEAASGAAGGAVNMIREVLDMHSPSKVMMNLGEMAGQGFAAGLAGTAGAVAAAASALAAAATGTINGALASIGGGVMRASAGGARSYNASSNLYIGTYNQQSAGDVSTLANAMAHAQQQLRKGFGGRV